MEERKAMKKTIISLLSAFLLTSICFGVYGYGQEEITGNLDFVYKESSAVFDRYEIVKDWEGKPCIALYYTYTNNRTTPNFAAGEFYLEAFQDGYSLDSTFLEYGTREETTNYTKDIKNGASLHVVTCFRLSNESSPVEFSAMEFENYTTTNDIVIDISRYQETENSTESISSTEAEEVSKLTESEELDDKLKKAEKRIEELEKSLEEANQRIKEYEKSIEELNKKIAEYEQTISDLKENNNSDSAVEEANEGSGSLNDEAVQNRDFDPLNPNEMSAGQRNAFNAANDYLAMMPFSKTGLKEQLIYEGYAEEDAEFAVNAVDVSWKEQAYMAAVKYLEMMSFSKDALIQQLEYEGYTQDEATYGAEKAYQ